MRKISPTALMLLSLIITTAAITPPARAQVIDEQERKEGFVAMFNGRDFSGWQFDQKYTLPDPIPKNWSVADGVIRLSGGGSPHMGSQWDYEDFEMRFQWRAMRERYNSGFFIRSNRKVRNNQINLAKGAEGRFFGGKMKGGPAVPELQNKPMQWNEWRVRIVGDKVTFWCNGKLAWEGTEFGSKRGHIGLQAEGAPLEFRNLRIKDIGWTPLNSLDDWKLIDGGKAKMEGDAILLAGNRSALFTTKTDYTDYVLRLEWQAETKTQAALTLRGRGSSDLLTLNANEKIDNPPGQWNYLEVHVAGGKATATQNGGVLIQDLPLEINKGPIAVTHKEHPLKIRNVRIKPLAD